MLPRPMRGPLAAAALLLTATSLVACTPASFSHADEVVNGIPDGWQGPLPDPLDPDLVVGWLPDDRFGVVTMGSSSCPPVAREPEVVSESAIAVEFDPAAAEMCTADLGPTTHVFTLPAEVTARPVTVTVTFVESGHVRELTLP